MALLTSQLRLSSLIDLNKTTLNKKSILEVTMVPKQANYNSEKSTVIVCPKAEVEHQLTVGHPIAQCPIRRFTRAE